MREIECLRQNGVKEYKMITSRKEYLQYLDADKQMLGKAHLTGLTGRYLLWLRRTEYHINVNHLIRKKFSGCILKFYSILSGICIPPNTFGKGLGLFHYGTIVVNPTARFGDYCGIQTGVNIAENVVGGLCLFGSRL